MSEPTPEECALEKIGGLNFGIVPPAGGFTHDQLPNLLTEAIRDEWFSGRDVIRWIAEAVATERERHAD